MGELSLMAAGARPSVLARPGLMFVTGGLICGDDVPLDGVNGPYQASSSHLVTEVPLLVVFGDRLL